MGITLITKALRIKSLTTFIVYFHTTSQLPRWNSSLITANKLEKMPFNFAAGAMFVFNII
jgi:hypothetical protein